MWATPEGTEKVMLHHDNFTLPSGAITLAPAQGDAFGMTEDDLSDLTPIYDTSGEKLIAMKKGNNTVWIMFDLIHSDQHIESIMQYILTTAFPSARIEEIDVRQAFSQYFATFLERQHSGIESRMNEAMRNLEQYSSEYQRRATEFYNRQRELEGARAEVEKLREGSSDMFDKCLQVEGIDSARLTPTKMTLLTHPIMLGPFNIGRYRIEMNEENGVLMKNVNYSSWGNQHPHVTAAGSPCWGTLRDATKYFRTGEWDLLLIAAVKLLQSYNGDNPFCGLVGWLQNVSQAEYRKARELMEREGKNIKRISPDGSIVFGGSRR
jgi:hypothetical protein